MNKKLWMGLASAAMLAAMPLHADQRDLDAVVVPDVDIYGAIDIAGIRSSPFVQALPKDQDQAAANPVDEFLKDLGLKSEDIKEVRFAVSFKRLDPEKPVEAGEIDLVVAVSLAKSLSYEKLRQKILDESKKNDVSAFVPMDFGRLPGFWLCEGKKGKPTAKGGKGVYVTESWDGKVVFFTSSKSTMMNLASRCTMGKSTPIALSEDLNTALQPFQTAQIKLAVLLSSDLQKKLLRLVEKQNEPPPPAPTPTVPGGPGTGPGGPGGPGAGPGGPGGPGAGPGGPGAGPGGPGGPGAGPGGPGAGPGPGPGGPGGPGAGPGPGGPGGPGAGPGGPGGPGAPATAPGATGPGAPGTGPAVPGAATGTGVVQEAPKETPVPPALVPYKEAKHAIVGILFKQNMNLRIVIGFNDQRNAALATQQMQGYIGMIQMMAAAQGAQGAPQPPQNQAAAEIVKGITAKNPTAGVMQLDLMVTGKQAEAMQSAIKQGVTMAMAQAENAKKKPQEKAPVEEPKLDPPPGGAQPPPAKPNYPFEAKPGTTPPPPAINDPNKPAVGTKAPGSPEVGFGKPRSNIPPPAPR